MLQAVLCACDCELCHKRVAESLSVNVVTGLPWSAE